MAVSIVRADSCDSILTDCALGYDNNDTTYGFKASLNAGGSYYFPSTDLSGLPNLSYAVRIKVTYELVGSATNDTMYISANDNNGNEVIFKNGVIPATAKTTASGDFYPTGSLNDNLSDYTLDIDGVKVGGGDGQEIRVYEVWAELTTLPDVTINADATPMTIVAGEVTVSIVIPPNKAYPEALPLSITALELAVMEANIWADTVGLQFEVPEVFVPEPTNVLDEFPARPLIIECPRVEVISERTIITIQVLPISMVPIIHTNYTHLRFFVPEVEVRTSFSTDNTRTDIDITPLDVS